LNFRSLNFFINFNFFFKLHYNLGYNTKINKKDFGYEEEIFSINNNNKIHKKSLPTSNHDLINDISSNRVNNKGLNKNKTKADLLKNRNIKDNLNHKMEYIDLDKQ